MADQPTGEALPSSGLLGVLLVGLLIASVAATFAPWSRSGEARRSSYDVVRAADRLEVIGPTARRVGRVVWATLPVAAALALLAMARERRSLAAGIAGYVGVVQGSLALALDHAPDAADWGGAVALVLAASLIVTAAATIVSEKRTTSWPTT